MGSYLVSVPQINDSDLIYSEDETKNILKFFFESRSKGIDGLEITNEVKRFAQTLMIAALQGTYEMGFIEDTFNVLSGVIRSGKSPGILGLGKKLAQKFGKRWFRHMTQSDMQNPKIYIAVRNSISNSMVTFMDSFLNGLASSTGNRGNGMRRYIVMGGSKQAVLA